MRVGGFWGAKEGSKAGALPLDPTKGKALGTRYLSGLEEQGAIEMLKHLDSPLFFKTT